MCVQKSSKNFLIAFQSFFSFLSEIHYIVKNEEKRNCNIIWDNLDLERKYNIYNSIRKKSEVNVENIS